MDNDTTLRETLDIVIAKMANKIPMSNEKEMLCEKMISEWCSQFGYKILQYDATILYEDFLKTLHEWMSEPLTNFIQSLGFNYNEVFQESDNYATLVKDNIIYTFYVKNDKATLSIFNNVEYKTIDFIRFKFVNGEWNEEES